MLINTGVYKANDQLPSIRSLSKELNINVNTVKKAFSELELEGITYSAQGRGVFVAENPIGNEKIKKSAIDDIRQSLSSGKAKGVSKTEVIKLVNDIYEVGEGND